VRIAFAYRATRARAKLPCGAVTAWDLRAFARALSLAGLLLVLAWLVTAATDEGGVAWGVRAGRALPLTPACAAAGAWIALAPGRARGEILALSSLGRAPWQNALGAAIGGAALALSAATAMAAAPSVDVSGFFPVAGHPTEYVYDGATFVDPARGVRIEADGSFTKLDADDAAAVARPDAVPRHGRAAAALATALAGVALPMLASMVLLARSSAARAIGLVFVAVAVMVVLFHAAAALRLPALVAPVPAAILLAVAAAVFFARSDGVDRTMRV
jgi:hypothetical protein